jgi:membrane-bound serine protease (ClpP class)
VIPIQGPLSEPMLALTIRGIRRAHETGAGTVLFEIDTEGGDTELMDRLIDEIERADDLESIAFVTQKAASAGALIAISCDRLYMSPGSNIGSALPVIPALFGMPLDPKTIGGSNDDPFWKKIRGHFRAHFRAKAQKHGRPAALAEAMVYAEEDVFEIEVDGVRKFVAERELQDEIAQHGEAAIHRVRTICKTGDVLNLTAQEALAAGMIDGLAASRQDLLEQRGLANAPLLVITQSWSEGLAGFTQSFGIFLLIAGLVAIFVEIKVPGFGLPGILGGLLVGLWLFGKYLSGLADFTEILLIVAGFALIATEVFLMPGTLLPGILGVVALVAGLVLASQETALPQSDRPFAEVAWWATARSLAIGLVIGVVAMMLVAHFFPSIPFLNRAVLKAGSRGASLVVGRGGERPLDEADAKFRPAPGARGVARTVLRPAGKVEVDGRELDAVSEGPLVARGEAVTVVRVEAAYVVVRRDAGSA